MSDSSEDRLLEECERGLADLAVGLAHSYEVEDRWQDSLSAALAGLLEGLDLNLELAELLIVRAPHAGPRVQARRAQVLAELADIVYRGALEAPAGSVPAERAVAEGVVTRMLAVLHERLSDTRDTAPLLELHGQLLSMALAPYLGAEAAAQALTVAPGFPLPKCSHFLKA